MAAVVSLGVGKVESFEGRLTRESYRLPPSHIETLRLVFCEAESEAGLKSCWAQDVDGMVGLRIPDADRVHMFDAEAWCDRMSVFATDGRSAKVLRAREALSDLVEMGDARAAMVLRRVYGHPSPSGRYDLFPEVAAIVEMCDVVVNAAKRAEADRKRVAKDRFDAFWATTRDGAGKARRLHIDKVLGDAPLDTAGALRDGLDVHVHKREDESKGSHSERQMVRRSERVEFIAAAAKQASAMLEAASKAYLEAWRGIQP